MPRYKCKNTAALDIALGGLPAKMRVEADVGTGVSAKTVGELRKVTTWPENLVITTPQEHHPESAVKISKASVATRTSPKTVEPLAMCYPGLAGGTLRGRPPPRFRTIQVCPKD
jgi:hypothetical protein